MKNLKTQGFVLIDVDVAALNNAGKSTSTQLENGVATKKIRKNGRSYTYISGQAWRYWWRNTLQQTIGWNLSPIIREAKVAFIAANPIAYDDDDIFGYMKAAKEVVTDEKGKEKKEDVTVTRVSPLKNSAIISVTPSATVEHWSSMSRQDGDPVPYTKEEYSAVMKGMFSLDLTQVGTFASYNRTGFKNLSEKLRKEALAAGGVEVDDPFAVTRTGEAQKLVRLPREVRLRRITGTLQALKFISGGAMQTNNLNDVAPKFVILATTTSGNHPFSHVAIGTTTGFEQQFSLNVPGLEEVLDEFSGQIVGKVFIGVRSGFLRDEDATALRELADKLGARVELLPVNAAIDGYVRQVSEQVD
ncbi:MAG: type I-B CRISPR-associated protein Cas7/Cst2/DevR [Siphonobacter aquaeclarae]|nr:type I-B CRISPR-associated protein Cas7/Cst2/DevR [Siphonobacter aquaeclarae]